MLGLSKIEEREAMAKALALLTAGNNDDECANQMGISRNDFSELKHELLEREAERLRDRTTEEVYAQYVIDQLSCIQDLLSVQNLFKSGKQANALVGAIRARSDIFDKIVTRGQEFGFIEKQPDRKVVTGGMLLAEMSTTDLRRAVRKKLIELDETVRTTGRDVKGLLDLPTEEIYRELPKSPKRSKSVKAKSNKVHGGRSKARRKK